MKLRWFDRLLLVIASLFLIAEAVCIALLALGIGEATFAFMAEVMLYHNVNRVILCIVALLLLIIGLRLLFLRARRANAPTAVFMQSTEAGTIRITVAAIEAIIQRASRGNAQVRDVKCRVIPLESNQMKVALRVMLAPDANAKEVSCALQSTVKSALEDNTGIPVPEVEIMIEAAPAPSGVPTRVE